MKARGKYLLRVITAICCLPWACLVSYLWPDNFKKSPKNILYSNSYAKVFLFVYMYLMKICHSLKSQKFTFYLFKHDQLQFPFLIFPMFFIFLSNSSAHHWICLYAFSIPTESGLQNLDSEITLASVLISRFFLMAAGSWVNLWCLMAYKWDWALYFIVIN